MEITDVGNIVFNVLFIYAIVFFIVIPIALPIIRIRKLHKIIEKKDDSKLFFIKIDKYISKIGNKKLKYIFILMKLLGVMCFKNWDELDSTVKDVEINYISSTWTETYCSIVLSLIILEKEDAGKRLLHKIIESPKLNKKKVWVMIIFAANEFYKGNLLESNKKFVDLLPLAKTNYEKAMICYYLGIIEHQKQDIEKSIEFYEKTKVLGKDRYLERKAQEALDNLSINKFIEEGDNE